MRPRTLSSLWCGDSVAKRCTQRLTLTRHVKRRNIDALQTEISGSAVGPIASTWMMMGMKARKGSTCEALREGAACGLCMKASLGGTHVNGSRHVLMILHGRVLGPYPVANRGRCKDFSIETPLTRTTFGTNNVSRSPGTGS